MWSHVLLLTRTRTCFSFGLIPAQPLNITAPLLPNQSLNASLPLNTSGPVQRMEPLANLQVAIKNSVDIFYFACQVPMHALFVEDGEMDKRVFLATWKDIPAQNEVQRDITHVQHNAGEWDIIHVACRTRKCT